MAAQQDFCRAEYSLGLIYHKGYGVKQDYAQAIYWYKRAAQQKFSNAQLNLGVMYEEGQGVQKNITKAKQWYQLACDNGLPKACENYQLLMQ